MEQWRESLLAVMEERFDAVFAAVQEKNPDVRAALRRQRDASALVRSHPGYDAELKQSVAQYFEAMQLLQGAYNRALYIQGARDCADALRELGLVR